MQFICEFFLKLLQISTKFPIYLLKKNPPISVPAQLKTMTFKGQLHLKHPFFLVILKSFTDFLKKHLVYAHCVPRPGAKALYVLPHLIPHTLCVLHMIIFLIFVDQTTEAKLG